MEIGERHLTREDLLRLHDGELSCEKAEAACDHLSHCPQCSRGLENIKATSQVLNDTWRVETVTSDVSGRTHLQARACLNSQLRREASEGKFSFGSVSWPRALGYASIGLLGIALSTLELHRYAAHQSASAYIDERALPNPRLTPGDVSSVALSDVCPSKDDDKDPPLPMHVQQIVFDEYGVSASADREHFQVDYLINPQLGGTARLQNLWPQPYQSAVWNAYAKDELEDRLHGMVCEHQISLAQAQREIAEDWIHAYKKYFQTEIPVPREALLEDGN